MEATWQINQDVCKRCGKCVDVCPNRILEKGQDGLIAFRQDRLWECFSCGHCMAICPNEAISIPGLDYEKDFSPAVPLLEDAYLNYENLISSRRAIRNFKQKPVPHDVLEKIVAAIQKAPPAFPPIKTELTVVEDPQKMREALPMMIELYERLVKMLKNPIASQFIKRSAGPEKYKVLQTHLKPLLEERMPDLKSGKEDTLTRHAPCMILFHANRNSENYRTDSSIAVAFGLLAAHSLGLGAAAMDIIPPAIEKSKKLRELFQIPDENEVVASMILGYPKHEFSHTINRELKSVHWV
jgi:ferredoxin